MKLWVDDIRPAPEDWKWIKNAQEFVTYEILGHICEGNVKEISFDHDLGEESSQNGYQLLNLLEEMIAFKLLPKENVPILSVHSMNPVGRKNIQAAIESIKRLSL
jgi:hypothetical protein